MMPIQLNIARFALASVLSVFLATPLRAQLACMPADHSVEDVQAQIREFVSATDSLTVSLREKLELPATDTALVTHETSGWFCDFGARRIAEQTAYTAEPPLRIWVLKVAEPSGSYKYVVWNGDTRSGRLPIHIVNANFTILKTYQH
jgi:hypothetical protein